MKVAIYSIVFSFVFFALVGCASNNVGYKNPKQFDNSSMAVIMIDQTVDVVSIDNQPYKEYVSPWEYKKSIQKNIIITMGSHTIEVKKITTLPSVVFESSSLFLNFTAVPGYVYRLLPLRDKEGNITVGIINEDGRLVSSIHR